MDSFPEELLVPPRALIALLSDAPFVEALAAGLRAASSGTAGPPLRARYDALPAGGAAGRFPRKERSHTPGEYDSYAPAGILRSNWLRKHATLPAALVRDARARRRAARRARATTQACVARPYRLSSSGR